MKIILATTQFMPELGGVPRLLWKLIVHKPDNIDLSVLSVCQQNPESYREFDKSAPVHIERVEPVPGSWFTSLKFAFHLLGMIRREKADLVMCGVGFPTAIVAAFVNIISGIPYAVYTHSEDLTIHGRAKRYLLGQALNNASVVFVLGNFGRLQLEKLGVHHPPVYEAPPGIDPEPFLQTIDLVINKQGNQKFILLTVARLVYRKGQDLVIRALPEIRKHIPGVKYQIVGRGPDEPGLRALVAENQVEDCVEFLGEVTDEELPSYYKACDIFVMPTRPSDDLSEVEGFGIVYLEAGAAGKPVIGGNSGGVEGAVVNGVTGYLIDPTDVDELIQRVEKIGLDPQLAKQMGETARGRVMNEFTAKIFSNKVYSAITQAVRAGRKLR